MFHLHCLSLHKSQLGFSAWSQLTNHKSQLVCFTNGRAAAGQRCGCGLATVLLAG
jgi:hypothetical protein